MSRKSRRNAVHQRKPAELLPVTRKAGPRNSIPVQSSDRKAYAGIILRIIAATIDYLLLAIVIVLLGTWMGAVLPSTNGSHIKDFIFAVTALVVSIGYLAYFAASPLQATPGKAVLRLRITSLDGKAVSIRQALTRESIRFVLSMVLILGLVLIPFTPRRQALHDLAAQTYVVKDWDWKQNGNTRTVIHAAAGILLAFLELAIVLQTLHPYWHQSL